MSPLSALCRKRTYLQCYLNLLLESSLWRHHRESRCGGGFSHPGFACFRGAIGTILASDRTRESMAPGAAVLATRAARRTDRLTHFIFSARLYSPEMGGNAQGLGQPITTSSPPVTKSEQ